MSTQIGIIPSDPYVTPVIVPTPGLVIPGVVQTITTSLGTIISGTTPELLKNKNLESYT